jgi:hypothetical protein
VKRTCRIRSAARCEQHRQAAGTARVSLAQSRLPPVRLRGNGRSKIRRATHEQEARYWRREPSWWKMIIPVIIIVAAIALAFLCVCSCASVDRTAVATFADCKAIGSWASAKCLLAQPWYRLMFQNAPVSGQSLAWVYFLSQADAARLLLGWSSVGYGVLDPTYVLRLSRPTTPLSDHPRNRRRA